MQDEHAEQAAEMRADAEQLSRKPQRPEDESRSILSLNPDDYDISESNDLSRGKSASDTPAVD